MLFVVPPRPRLLSRRGRGITRWEKLKIAVIVVIIVVSSFLAPLSSSSRPVLVLSREMFLATATWENKELQKRFGGRMKDDW